jgi:hypothetical protein
MNDGSISALGRWISPHHLSGDAVARYRASFRADAFASLALDDFLLPARLALLQQCFGKDAAFERNFGLIEPLESGRSFAERWADEPTFYSAPEESRLAREFVMTGHAEGCEESEGWTANLDFFDLLESPAFADYLTAITGVGDLHELSFLPRVMQWGDFCRAHDDTAGTRRMCILFYVDDGWRPGFGGRFQNVVDGKAVRSVDPLANRVLLHEPRTDLIHQVESFTNQAALWKRCSYSIWFSARA